MGRTGLYEKFWSQMVRGVSRSPFSSDFEMEMTTDGDKGHIVVRAEKEGNAFNNFLTIAGTVAGGADLTPHRIRLLQTGRELMRPISTPASRELTSAI